MQIVNKLMMVSMSVGDMQKAKEFYIDKLGLKVATEYRQDDDNWWVSLKSSDGETTITLARAKDNVPASAEGMKAGTLALYFETSDIEASHKELEEKGLKINEIMDDLFGPGSGVKFFNFEDPDGNWIHIVEKHEYVSSTPF